MLIVRPAICEGPETRNYYARFFPMAQVRARNGAAWCVRARHVVVPESGKPSPRLFRHSQGQYSWDMKNQIASPADLLFVLILAKLSGHKLNKLFFYRLRNAGKFKSMLGYT